MPMQLTLELPKSTLVALKETSLPLQHHRCCKKWVVSVSRMVFWRVLLLGGFLFPKVVCSHTVCSFTFPELYFSIPSLRSNTVQHCGDFSLHDAWWFSLAHGMTFTAAFFRPREEWHLCLARGFGHRIPNRLGGCGWVWNILGFGLFWLSFRPLTATPPPLNNRSNKKREQREGQTQEQVIRTRRTKRIVIIQRSTTTTTTTNHPCCRHSHGRHYRRRRQQRPQRQRQHDQHKHGSACYTQTGLHVVGAAGKSWMIRMTSVQFCEKRLLNLFHILFLSSILFLTP